ncbi:polycystic kidney disease 2-like 2 protein isoform X1 [Drosophila miranda]|uniref:polycystic kidney disease 2-like 2 protein isoform X1 n=2 Tax=Drosophila miranda TaxID=7229 RepID=UPI00143F6444|nr:polycystic kidney disease 2-like 2 protein isoform X1 [Drosophila miranda]
MNSQNQAQEPDPTQPGVSKDVNIGEKPALRHRQDSQGPQRVSVVDISPPDDQNTMASELQGESETQNTPKTKNRRLRRMKFPTERRSLWRSKQAPQGLKLKTSRILYTTDEQVRDALFEFLVFIVFLGLTSLITLTVRSPYMFYFNDTTKKLFVTRSLVVAPSLTNCFENILIVSDWWDYLIYNFLITLHGDMTELDEDEDEKVTSVSGSDPIENLRARRFMHENLLLGPPRLRQIRVQKQSCYMSWYFDTCYDDYSQGAEERTETHKGSPYRTMGEVEATPFWTLLAYYSSGGYTVDLTYDKDINLQKINDLKNINWLDRSSRLCMVEFNLFNENTDIFQSVKLMAEIPASGVVIPQARLQTVKQYSFFTDPDPKMTVLYLVWYIMIVYYTILEINEIRLSGLKMHFKSFLNILEGFLLTICYLALVYNVWHTIEVKSITSKAQKKEVYQSIDVLCFSNIIYVNMMAVLAFLVWIKLFKFISLNKTLVEWTTTLGRCSKDLAGFSLMFGIVFVIYARLGLLLFGSNHPDFYSLVISMLTMIRMILGDFRYNLIQESDRVIGPIYFITYILLVFFILLNIFLAIIMESYSSVKSGTDIHGTQLASFVYRKLTGAVYWIYCRICKTQSKLFWAQLARVKPFRAKTARPSATAKKADLDVTTVEFEEPVRRRNMTAAETVYFNAIPRDVKNKKMFRVNQRITLLEEVLEKLVTNIDDMTKSLERVYGESTF